MILTRDRIRTELLGMGSPPAPAAPELARELVETILDGTRAAAEELPANQRVVLTKWSINTVGNCEQLYSSESAAAPGAALSPPLVAGLVVHRAIVACHTHPDRPPDDYVSGAVSALRRERRSFDEWWQRANVVEAADAISRATNGVAAWMRDWPPMPSAWAAQFEPTLDTRLGPLVLRGRPDLSLGAPRETSVPSMVIIDFKTSPLHESHAAEARLYALLATIKYGVPPARTAVYSLPTGSWTFPPQVTAAGLRKTAADVIDAAGRVVALMAERGTPLRSPGDWCRWCPVRSECGERDVWENSRDSDTPRPPRFLVSPIIDEGADQAGNTIPAAGTGNSQCGVSPTADAAALATATHDRTSGDEDQGVGVCDIA